MSVRLSTPPRQVVRRRGWPGWGCEPSVRASLHWCAQARKPRRPGDGTGPLQTFRKWDTLPKVTATGALFRMPKPVLRIVSPDTVKRKVTPRRPKNADVRTREYLTEREVERLIEGCRGNRRPHRDATMILLAFRHGLRASEVCDLQWT